MFSGSLAVVPTVCSAVARTSGFAPCLLRGAIVLQHPSNTVAARDHTSLFRFILSHSEEKLLLFSFFHHPKNRSSVSVVRLIS